MEQTPTEVAMEEIAASRQEKVHLLLAAGSGEKVNIFHTEECLTENPGLNACPFSLAYSQFGVDLTGWPLHTPVQIGIDPDGKLERLS